MPEWINEEWKKQVSNTTIPSTQESQMPDYYCRDYLKKDQTSFDKIPQERVYPTILRKVRTDFLANYSTELLPQDLLPEIFPELKITQQESIDIVKFLELDKIGLQNPTNYSLMQKLLESLRYKQPLEICVSYCIGKNPQVRLNKLRKYFGTDRLGSFDRIDNYFTGIEVKGLDKLRTLANISSFKIRTNIMLGDMDFWTLDCANEWLDSKDLISSQLEVEALKLGLESEIQTNYPEINIECTKWSNKYSLSEFQLQYENAKETVDKWLSPELLKQSVYPYFEFWAYADIQEKLKLTRQEMEKFIKEDLIRTASQYRLESKILNENIMIWAESTANPIWPLVISDYDKAGIPPSISI